MAAVQQPTIFYLQGSDDERVAISEPAIRQCKTLDELVNNFMGDTSSVNDMVIPITNFPSVILKKIVAWCEHHQGEATPTEEESQPRCVEIPAWDMEYLTVTNKELFDIIHVANYLDVKMLLNFACKKVSDMAKGKTTEEMRVMFGIPSDKEVEAENAEKAELGAAVVGAAI